MRVDNIFEQIKQYSIELLLLLRTREIERNCSAYLNVHLFSLIFQRSFRFYWKHGTLADFCHATQKFGGYILYNSIECLRNQLICGKRNVFSVVSNSGKSNA